MCSFTVSIISGNMGMNVVGCSIGESLAPHSPPTVVIPDLLSGAVDFKDAVHEVIERY